MTDDEIDAIRRRLSESRMLVGSLEWAGRSRGDVKTLLAEVDRLRALPVLPTCDDCVYLYAPGRSCEHPRAITPGTARQVERFPAPPPTWCPQRGAR